MSRSYHQKHPTAHNPHNRIPNPFRDKEGNVRRDRAIRPYGYKGWCGWGGEMYFKKFGEIMVDLVNKRKARRESRKIINDELNSIGK